MKSGPFGAPSHFVRSVHTPYWIVAICNGGSGLPGCTTNLINLLAITCLAAFTPTLARPLLFVSRVGGSAPAQEGRNTMKRLLIAAAAFASLALATFHTPSMAATSASISIGDPYRGAAVRFHSEPQVVMVPETRVYYVRDYGSDVYRYGSSW